MGTSDDLAELTGKAEASAAKVIGEGNPAEEQRTVDILKTLREISVTKELLQSTGAGKRINKLGKHTSAKISGAAKATVAAWQEAVLAAARKDSGAAADDKGKAVKEEKGAAGGAGAGGDAEGEVKVKTEPEATLPLTDDDVRNKLRQSFLDAFRIAAAAGVSGDPVRIAVSVEEAMFRKFNNQPRDKEYKNKARQLLFNLKDPKNPDLRASVLNGDIYPADLIMLSPEELGSNERREKNDKIRQQLLFECERGQSDQASTDQFKCGKCKQRKCTYYQLQTRSADEPMTTFVTCVNCNNRWKFC